MKNKALYLSNLSWQKKEWHKVMKKLQINKLYGIDFAPLQLTKSWINIEKKVKKYSLILKKNRIKVNAIQGIFYKKKLNLFEKKSKNFSKIIDHINIILRLCEILKCKKIIMGSTEFRNKKNMTREIADEIFCNFLKKISPILKKKKITLCIETIPKEYNEKYLYNFEHLVRLIKIINCSWIGINFDTSLFHYKKIDLVQFKKNINLIKNIQITEKKFNYFINPSKRNIVFCNTIKKIKKIKEVSLEIIVNKTNLKNLDRSMNNLMNLLN